MKSAGFPFLFAFCFLLFMTGCAAVPERPPLADPARAWQMRKQELAPIAAWNIHGRFAMRRDGEGWQGSLHWVRDHARQRISLTGPLGSGQLRLTQDEHGAQLRDAEQNVLHAPDARELLRRATGWDLPLEGINWWVLGLPVPGAPGAEELDAWGRLKALQQLGWDVQFLEYTRADRHELPSRLFLRRAANGAGEFEVRLAIERWRVRGEE